MLAGASLLKYGVVTERARSTAGRRQPYKVSFLFSVLPLWTGDYLSTMTSLTRASRPYPATFAASAPDCI